MIDDFSAIVVGKDNLHESWDVHYAALKGDTRGVTIDGGSALGSMDHPVPEAIMQAAGSDPLDMRFVAYDTGGKAMVSCCQVKSQHCPPAFPKQSRCPKRAMCASLA